MTSGTCAIAVDCLDLAIVAGGIAMSMSSFVQQ
jgi:hypothetical protein